MNLALAEEVLNHIHNWFVRDSRTFSGAEFSGGSLPDEIEGYVSGVRFYRIQGTYLNDGLHMRGAEGAPDGSSGQGGTDMPEIEDEAAGTVVVSLMAVPKSLLAIIDEIAEWEEKYGEVAKGPFFSESFGGYEYEIRGYSSYGAASSSQSGWRLAFANRLNPWRKMW